MSIFCLPVPANICTRQKNIQIYKSAELKTKIFTVKSFVSDWSQLGTSYGSRLRVFNMTLLVIFILHVQLCP